MRTLTARVNKKAPAFITLLIACIFISALTGCWDYNEVNQLAIVPIMALDFNHQSSKPYMIGIKIIRPAAVGSGQTTGGPRQEGKKAWYVEGSGYTFEDSLDSLRLSIPRKLFLNHNNVILVGKNLAEEGLDRFIDYTKRKTSIRRTSMIYMTHEKSLETLGVDPKMETFIYSEILGLTRHAQLWNIRRGATLNDFLADLSEEGINPVLPVLRSRTGSAENVGREFEIPSEKAKNELILDQQIAVFKDIRLAGFLSGEDVMGFFFLRSKISGGTVLVPTPDKNDSLTSIRIKSSSFNIKPIIRGSDLFVETKLLVNADLIESKSLQKFHSKEEVDELGRKTSEVLSGMIKASISKLQNEIRSDAVGFGAAFHRKYPKEWKTLKDNWDELWFPSLGIEIDVKVNIISTGHVI